jgi:hypothetical protein
MSRGIHPESASTRRSGAIRAALLLCANSGRESMLGRWGGFVEPARCSVVAWHGRSCTWAAHLSVRYRTHADPGGIAALCCLSDTPTRLSYDLALAPFTVPVIF